VFTKVIRYNLCHIPNDVIEIVGIHNFFALGLAFIYYVGGAAIIYGTLKLGLPWSLFIWLIAAAINIQLAMKLPGLFYLDDVRSQDAILSTIILGPINFLRAFCLWITFIIRVKTTYPYSLNQMFKTPPETWSVDDEWIKTIQRSRDIEMRTLVGDIRWLLCTIGRWLWKVGNTKINAWKVIHALFTITLIFAVLMAILVAWFMLTGKI
jgi:hypothetical protein